MITHREVLLNDHNGLHPKFRVQQKFKSRTLFSYNVLIGISLRTVISMLSIFSLIKCCCKTCSFFSWQSVPKQSLEYFLQLKILTIFFCTLSISTSISSFFQSKKKYGQDINNLFFIRSIQNCFKSQHNSFYLNSNRARLSNSLSNYLLLTYYFFDQIISAANLI